MVCNGYILQKNVFNCKGICTAKIAEMFFTFYCFTGAGSVIGVFGLYMGKSISKSEKYETTGILLPSILFPF